MNLTNSDDNSEQLLKQVREKINFGEHLIQRTNTYSDLGGIHKLSRKIKQELNFLRKVIKTSTIKKEHIQCSNLTHFGAVIDALVNVEKCIGVNKVVILDNRKITVDIISDSGFTWIKVVARNPKSLSQICMGDASFGVRSILDHAQDFIEAAKLNPCLFKIPKVIFIFSNGVGKNLATRLECLGVKVEGIQLTDIDIGADDAFDENFKQIQQDAKPDTCSLSTPNVSHLKKVNLDISAMLAYVSSVCNGSADLYEFPAGVLAQQAEWERLRPQKPRLDNFFEGKELYCCQTAKDNFISIVETVGGPNEQKRAHELLSRIKVLPDDAAKTAGEDSFNVQWTPNKILPLGGKVKQRSLIIFTFGDRLGAVTATSNDGFVRSAKQQGINFVVFVHESRALTEQKEQTRAIGVKS